MENALLCLHKFINKSVNVELINQASTIMAECLKGGRNIISCGNGGSMCDAMHFAEELSGQFRKNRKPLVAIAMNDTAYLSCVGNDFSFEYL